MQEFFHAAWRCEFARRFLCDYNNFGQLIEYVTDSFAFELEQ